MKKKDTHTKHSDNHDDGHDHDPDHAYASGGIFGEKTEMVFSLLTGVLLAAGFGLEFVETIPRWLTIGILAVSYIFGAFFLVQEAYKEIAKGKFQIDFLMLIAAAGTAILGEWAEGALLLFLFSIGHALEHYAMNKAKKSIAALAGLAPKTALLKVQNDVKEVQISELKAGDVIVIRPNTKIAADGVVVNGDGDVNQAPITGESIPVEKAAVPDSNFDLSKAERLDAKHRVFAGTINGNGLLEVMVSREAADSTVARLVKLVNEAQSQKSPTQMFTDKFERIFVPFVLVMVMLLCFAFVVIDEKFEDSFYRAMAVLVAASPCALAISTPSAVLSGVARAARAGVLIKGGKPLEDLGSLTAIAFDKTGTLTEGQPHLTHVVPLGELSENDVLRLAVAVEALSDHPLAKAIVRDGKKKLGDAQIPLAGDLEVVLGKGIRAVIGHDQFFMGNVPLFRSLDANVPGDNIVQQVVKLETEGNTTMLLRRNAEYIGIIAVMDTPRKEAAEVLRQLPKIGIRKMIMLTGDNQKVGDAVAKQIGITEAWGGLLPEDKVEAIRRLKEREKQVAMVGDGVNDAPAMANSTVGIAMGAAGSDVALETADVALLGDKLVLLPFAIALSRQSKRIIRQNILISLGVVAGLVPLTILGIASMGPAVIAHEGSTVIVVFNALRLLVFKNKAA